MNNLTPLFVQVDNPQTGYYYCVPESSQGLLCNSTATFVLSQAVYFHNPPCVTEEFLSTPQRKCAQISIEENIATPPSPATQTTMGTDSSDSMTTTVAMTETMPHVQVVVYVSIGAVIFCIVIAGCGVMIVVHYFKKRKRNRFPKSKGQRSRILRGLLLNCIGTCRVLCYTAIVCKHYLSARLRINNILILYTLSNSYFAHVLYTPECLAYISIQIICISVEVGTH